jgi:hypothetical protein
MPIPCWNKPACPIEGAIGGMGGGIMGCCVAIIGTGPAPMPIVGGCIAFDAYAVLEFTIIAGFDGPTSGWIRLGRTGGGGGVNTGTGSGGGTLAALPSGVMTEPPSNDAVAWPPS